MPKMRIPPSPRCQRVMPCEIRASNSPRKGKAERSPSSAPPLSSSNAQAYGTGDFAAPAPPNVYSASPFTWSSFAGTGISRGVPGSKPAMCFPLHVTSPGFGNAIGAVQLVMNGNRRCS